MSDYESPKSVRMVLRSLDGLEKDMGPRPIRGSEYITAIPRQRFTSASFIAPSMEKSYTKRRYELYDVEYDNNKETHVYREIAEPQSQIEVELAETKRLYRDLEDELETIKALPGYQLYVKLTRFGKRVMRWFR